MPRYTVCARQQESPNLSKPLNCSMTSAQSPVLNFEHIAYTTYIPSPLSRFSYSFLLSVSLQTCVFSMFLLYSRRGFFLPHGPTLHDTGEHVAVCNETSKHSRYTEQSTCFAQLPCEFPEGTPTASDAFSKGKGVLKKAPIVYISIIDNTKQCRAVSPGCCVLWAGGK